MNSAKFFSIEELKGALVVDSEGLIYGNLSEIEVKEEHITLIISAKVGNCIDIKGRVPVKEVRVIDRKELASPQGIRTKIAVLVLSTPREALYRGIKPESGAPKVTEPSELKGKLVVSLSKGILGYCQGLVIGAGEVGIRVVVEPPQISWLKLLEDLRARNPKAASALALKADPLKRPRIPLSEAKALLKGVEVDLARYLEGGKHLDLPWSSIVKVGDVIIVE